ncbi:nucleotidyltransferase domain-containing protein [Actinomycetes bacterium KLBMP 9797]
MTIATHTEYGDRDAARAGEILRTVVGSGVHGIAIAGTDDHDEMGVYIEPPATVLGLREPADHYVYRTQPEGARSGPGDTDLVMYSLRKYLRLAAKGNPTALLPLYAPADATLTLHPLGQELRGLATAILSQRAVRRFLGYLDAQRDRLTGVGRQGRVPNRPELVAQYGYDVKYASHALRLAYQGLEIVRDGRLTLPMPEWERERVLRVKRGDVADLGEVLREIAGMRSEVESRLLEGRTPLPADPDLDRVSAWSVAAHRRHWAWLP